MGDRIAVMRGGVLQQCGTPLEVYNSPANRFVAGFIGTPAMNLIAGTIAKAGSTMEFQFGLRRLSLNGISNGSTLPIGPVVLGIRPQDVHVRTIAMTAPVGNFVDGGEGAVRLVETTGDVTNVRIALDDREIVTRTVPSSGIRENDRLRSLFDVSRAISFGPTNAASEFRKAI